MSMTVLVTRDVPARTRGFLASCMLEIAPGVYTAPRMTKAIRERVWAVVKDWWCATGEGSAVMTWREAGLPGGQGMVTVGVPAKDLQDYDGLFLVRRDLPPQPAGGAPEGEASRAVVSGSLKTE